MNRSTLVRNSIAGTVAGLGLAVGGIAIASAGTAEVAAPAVSTVAGDSDGPGRGGPGHGRLGDALAETLASELNLDQTKVQAALETVRDDLRPDRDSTDGTRPEPPTTAERAEQRDALATALAAELDVDKADVLAALDVVQEKADAGRAEHQAEHRAELVTRLDEAVTAGTLTEADKTSVLKAFDADLLGGGRGGFGGPGF